MTKWIALVSVFFFGAFSGQGATLLAQNADSLFKTGRQHFLRGEFSLAQTDYFKCFNQRKKIYSEKDPEYEEVLYRIGELFYEAGNWETASQIAQNDLEISQRYFGRTSLQYARAIEMQGLLALEIDDYETAENYLRTANGIFSEQTGKTSEAFAQNLIYQGLLYATQGSFTAAEALFRQAKFILKKFPETAPVYSKLILATGELHEQLHNYTEAVQEFNLLISINRKLYGDQHPFISKAHFHLGKIFLQSGYATNAKAHVLSAYKGFAKYYGQNHLKTILAKAVVAAYYNQSKVFQKSDSVYKETLEALERQSEEKHVLNAKIESGIASLYYSMGMYNEAISYHQKSLEVIKEFLENSHPLYIQTVNDLSFLYWASGKKFTAESYFSRSTTNYINQFNRYFAFLSEQEKGYFYHDIRLFFDKYNSYILSQLEYDPQLTRDMYNNQLATKALLFHSSQEVRKQVMKSDDPGLKSKFAKWVEMKEHLSKLYKLVEEDNSQSNKDLLDSLDEKANFLEKEISLRIELDKKQKGNSLLEYKWEDIQKSLGPGEASVEIIRVQEFKPDSGGYFSNKVMYAVLIITSETKKHPSIVVLKDGETLETRILHYYRNCIQHTMKDGVSYTKFWKPIKTAECMKGVTKIYLSSDGVYNQVNLNTLIDPETDKAVLDELDIHLVTNTKDILTFKKRSTTKEVTSTALFGYPDYYKTTSTIVNGKLQATEQVHSLHRTRGHHDFKEIMRGGKIVDLPGTKAEIEEVSDIIKNEKIKTKIYLGADANEQHLKAIDNPSVLHIATHGYFMPDLDTQIDSASSDSMIFQSYNENPLTRSGIMLVGAGHAYSDETLERELQAVKTSEKFEDGILTAYEAMNINLHNTDLVILSACETGLGEVKNGEGVYGLQRALQTAGAKSVILSLWKVSDAATRKLMTYFYMEWVKNHNIRMSFRVAQAKLRQEFIDPIYWGAFVMTGE